MNTTKTIHVHTRQFALFGGILMVAIGALAFIPQLSQLPQFVPELAVMSSYGEFLAYFPMNVLSKVLFIAVGVIGIGLAQASNVEPSVKYSRAVAIVMAVLMVMGVFTATNTFFGYMPLFGGMILLNGLFAAAGAYYGYVVPAQVRRHVMKKTTFDKTAHI